MKRILIVQTAFIGDVILITPLIRAVRELYPDAEIDALVVPGAAKLLQNNPHLHNVISYPKRKYPLKSMMQVVQILKARHFDLAISPHSSGRTHLLLYLAGIPQRVGFDRGTMPWLLTLKTMHPKGIHKARKNLELMKLLSEREFSVQTELFPSTQDQELAEDLLMVLEGNPIIAMAPGSVWATKCWPVEYYASLAAALMDRGFSIVLIGAPEDLPKCEIIKKECPDALILAGKTNLLQSAAILSRCKMLICNDSGALHIANAMKTRVTAFFGPTVQRFGYFPFGPKDKVFEVDIQCRPCSSHGPQKCPLKHHDCMRRIHYTDVLNYIEDSFA
ncbi:MAG: lipopolysaccharide heptosyltransferase II [Candidatus Cloacimonetes bacterium]|jgi:heptosyltransferase-2|nr:lipopolysaccharide heptosyltransferase II [Candidatus Cloacimonadota bacterium]MDD2506455.1 lipopolysaccharide heptosyltransferase II [Candidatus Cloacimonadota bacterium]MDD4147813.1 lipopolysaccharide heptosyltransferase II [Candidatus Cloacimonadota bacterium]MDD4560001.1 lipopolysaccharide heptosyltransferase II [Candidatus Cloacimonadota bacterium]